MHDSWGRKESGTTGTTKEQQTGGAGRFRIQFCLKVCMEEVLDNDNNASELQLITKHLTYY